MHCLLILTLGVMCLSGAAFDNHPMDQRARKISSTLAGLFETDESSTANVMVNFKRKPGEVFDMLDIDTLEHEDRSAFHQRIQDEMQLLTRESQMQVLDFLDEETDAQVIHRSYWITNQIYVKGATKDLCESLGSFADVESIEEEKIFHIHEPFEMGPVIEMGEGEQINEGNVEWGVGKIRANDAWEHTDGSGCTVGVIDTGCRATHEVFAKDFLVDWHDAVNGKSNPYDDNGHGTHVTSTICGGKGVGVAPGAKIVSCKACNGDGGCMESDINECCQFMTQRRPNTISNSWGGPSGTASYTDVINSWKSLGIFTVFSAGNSGPSCGSIGSPADYVNVCSVGATTDTDSLAEFSSRGQCQNGMVGPTVSAPGHKITSAWSTSDKAYNTISGTSMAAPHVAGMSALLFSLNPSISFEQEKNAIINSCKFDGLGDTKQSCGGTSNSQKPNNMYGHGRVDCMSGVFMLQNQLKESKLKGEH